MTDASSDEPLQDPEQEHPAQEAHGGSMAPDLVDDTGHPVAEPPDVEQPEPQG